MKTKFNELAAYCSRPQLYIVVAATCRQFILCPFLPFHVGCLFSYGCLLIVIIQSRAIEHTYRQTNRHTFFMTTYKDTSGAPRSIWHTLVVTSVDTTGGLNIGPHFLVKPC